MRKRLIRKGTFGFSVSNLNGFSSIMPTLTPPYLQIQGINNYAALLLNFALLLNAQTDAMLSLNSKLGDAVSTGLLANRKSTDFLNSMLNIRDSVNLNTNTKNILGREFTFTEGKGSNLKQAFGKANIGSTMSIAGLAADMIGSFIPKKELSGLTTGLNSAYDSVSNAMMAIPGWGCVCAGTRVIDNKGRFVNIEDLKLEDGIVGWNDGCINKEKIVAFINPHEKECIEIELLSGTKLRCSIDHPILCSKGKSKEIRVEGRRRNIKVYEFIRADKINIGDNVGIANEIDIWGTSIMPNAYLIGMLIGDGSYGKDHGARLYSADSDTWNYIEKNQLGGKINYDDSRYNKEFRCYCIFNGASQLRDLGIYELTRLEKTLPKDIYKYTKESISLLLAGLFDTDGCVFFNRDKKEYKIYLAQSNRILLKEVSELLLKLGIHTSLQTVKEKKSVIKGRPVNSKLSYSLIIKDKWSIINFYNNIKLNISYKRLNLEDIYNYVITLNTKDNRYLAGVKADKVVKITKIGPLIIYNLQADDDHTYLANGIVTHNTIAGGIMKVGGLLSDGLTAMGVGTDQMTTTDKILDSKFLKMTPIGLINAFGAKKADTITKNNQAFELVGSSYGGTSATVDAALEKSGKKYGLLSGGARKDANREIAEAKRLLNIMTDIADTATDRFNILSSMSSIYNNRYAMALQGGYNLAAVRAGKSGMKIISDELILRARTTLKTGKALKQEVLSAPVYKDGGKMNVIPDGALHARLHHMDVDNITKKGIPVVSEENGELVLLAEIERNEIIFTKEATELLEKLYKLGTDEAAIEAGKIIAREIIENTLDNTGLISEVV